MASAGLVLVTGASGFIGLRLCAALAARGERVRALYRRALPPPELLALSETEGGRVELFNADLGDAARVREAVSGARAVIHAAALASDWGALEPFMRANYDATVGLLGAARDAGSSVFIHFSSAVVHGFGRHVDTTELGPYYPLKYPYQISKARAEEFVLAQDGPGFRVTVLRPCNVYGPGDHMSTYQMYDAIIGGVFGYIGTGEALTCPIYVDDLCAATLAALDREGTGGQVFLLSDGMKVSWKDYTRVMFEAVGSRKRPTSLPRPLAFAAARLMTLGASLVSSPTAPILTMYRVEQGSRDYHFSNAKARELLGLEPKVFYEEGLAITARAYLEDRRKTAIPEGEARATIRGTRGRTP